MEIDAGYSYDPILNTQYGEAPQRYCTTAGFPDTPVSPKELAEEVSHRLNSFNVKVPDNTRLMAEEMCQGFNECIRLNIADELPQTMIFSPKTGSAKSVTAMVYISLLKKVSSLVIVPTVEDANDFCKGVNTHRGEENYAKCYYKVTNEKPVTKYYVNKEAIYQPKCLVITHNMFKIINQYDDTKVAEDIKLRNDKFIVVDERLSHYNVNHIAKNELEAICTLLENLQNKSTKYNFENELKSLKSIIDLFRSIPNYVVSSDMPNDPYSRKDIVFVENNLYCKLKMEDIVNNLNFKEVYSLLIDHSIMLHQILNPLNKFSQIQESELRTNLKKQLHNIEDVLNNQFIYIQKGDKIEIRSIKSLFNSYGSIVVLDATATVNEIYEDMTYYNHMAIQHIETTDPRIYNNLTIHKVLNYPQSRDKIFKKKTPKENKESVKLYLKLAHSLILEPDDKLLIITFQAYRTMLEAQNTNKQIVFTHWGNHIGKNKWSDCNKVMIIGWNYMNDDVSVLNYINAIGNIEVAYDRLGSNTIQKYKTTQLVDDLVQATMRGSARRTLDTDGNCEKCDIYLFIPPNDIARNVYKKFLNEFKGAKEEIWHLKTTDIPKKNSKTGDKADSIIKYLDSKKLMSNDILQKDVAEALNFSTSTFDRIIKSDYFKEKLEEKGYSNIKKNGKSKMFIL